MYQKDKATEQHNFEFKHISDFNKEKTVLAFDGEDSDTIVNNVFLFLQACTWHKDVVLGSFHQLLLDNNYLDYENELELPVSFKESQRLPKDPHSLSEPLGS